MVLEEWQKRNKFIPLTYLEVKAHKPLVVKLNDDYNFVTYPQSALVFASILDLKDSILENILSLIKQKPKKKEKKEEKAKAYISAIMGLIEILYQISHQEYPKQKDKIKYRAILHDYGIRNTDILIEIWCKVLEQNTRLEKKNVIPSEIQPYTNTRPLDKWRGLLLRKDIEKKTFIEVLHEDEQATTNEIRRYKENKESNRRSKSNSKRHF